MTDFGADYILGRLAVSVMKTAGEFRPDWRSMTAVERRDAQGASTRAAADRSRRIKAYQASRDLRVQQAQEAQAPAFNAYKAYRKANPVGPGGFLKSQPGAAGAEADTRMTANLLANKVDLGDKGLEQFKPYASVAQQRLKERGSSFGQTPTDSPAGIRRDQDTQAASTNATPHDADTLAAWNHPNGTPHDATTLGAWAGSTQQAATATPPAPVQQGATSTPPAPPQLGAVATPPSPPAAPSAPVAPQAPAPSLGPKGGTAIKGAL